MNLKRESLDNMSIVGASRAKSMARDKKGTMNNKVKDRGRVIEERENPIKDVLLSRDITMSSVRIVREGMKRGGAGKEGAAKMIAPCPVKADHRGGNQESKDSIMNIGLISDGALREGKADQWESGISGADRAPVKGRFHVRERAIAAPARKRRKHRIGAHDGAREASS